MGRVYRRYRNIERTIKAYIENGLASTWNDVSVVFDEEDAKGNLPMIVVRQDSVPYRKQSEIGETTLEERFMVVITIYAGSDALREDLVSTIVDLLATGCTYYTYGNAVDPDSPVATQAGHLNIEFTSDNQIYPSENVQTYSKFVHKLVITAEIINS